VRHCESLSDKQDLWEWRSVLLVNGLKDVLEATVIGFENGVLGAEIEGPLFLQGVLKAGVGETVDGLVGVVHAEGNSSAREVEDLVPLLSLAIGRSVHKLKLSSTLDDQVSGTVLSQKRQGGRENQRSNLV